MLIYLMRHGVAVEAGPDWPNDADRPLTDQGRARVRQIAAGLLALDVQPDEILTSPFVRTRETADLVAEAFARQPRVTPSAALAPGVRPLDALNALGKYARRKQLLLVGHMPGIGALAARLVGARRALAFKKGAVCCVEIDTLPPSGPGHVQWFIPPKTLRRLGRTG
ncbi:MAG: phosphohistidine phosphatase SixA [Vicinamibacteraceae bacterium]|nr:phosphohistidine phosphatase SixA [Vicinamibacteraceae bacterium]